MKSNTKTERLEHIQKETLDNDFLDEDLLVSVKVDGTSLVVQNDSGNLKFYLRGGNRELTEEHRISMTLYEDVIRHIESCDWKSLPEGIKFFVEFFNDTKKSIIHYRSRPKNNMVILFAKDETSRFRPDDPVVISAAETLQISYPPIIHNGPLNEHQKALIKQYLSSEVNNFTGLIHAIFPLSRIMIMSEIGMEGIVIEGHQKTFKFVDPKFTQMIKEKSEIELKYRKALAPFIWEGIYDRAKKVLDERKHMSGEYLYFIEDLTIDILKTKASDILITLKDWADFIHDSKFTELNYEYVSSDIEFYAEKYFFVDDIFRSLLFGLKNGMKRTRPKEGIDTGVKKEVNRVYELLTTNHILG